MVTVDIEAEENAVCLVSYVGVQPIRPRSLPHCCLSGWSLGRVQLVSGMADIFGGLAGAGKLEKYLGDSLLPEQILRSIASTVLKDHQIRVRIVAAMTSGTEASESSMTAARQLPFSYRPHAEFPGLQRQVHWTS